MKGFNIHTKLGNLARPLATLLGARWDAAGDLGTDIAAIIAAIAAIAPPGGAPTGLYYYGVVTAVPGADQFTIPTLAGIGAGIFADATAPYRAFVLRDNGGAGALPQGEMRAITGYVTGTGVFTTTAFTAAVAAGDEILILHPRLAEIADLETRLTAVRAGYIDYLAAANLPTDIALIIAYVDELETRLTAGRAALLDEITALRLAELDAANIPADIDTLLARLTAVRAGYLDNINQAGLLQVTAARAGYLDELAAANLPADIDTLKAKLVVPTATPGTNTQNWNAAETTLVTLGADNVKNEIGSLFISVHNLVGIITVRRYTEINGVERKLYPDYIVDASAGWPGLPIIDAPLQIHEALRITLQSDNAADDAKAVHYDYMIKALV